MYKYLRTFIMFLLSTMASQAIEFELKQKFKSRNSVTVSSISDEIELKSKKKNRVTSKTRFITKFSPNISGLTPYIQLGYEWEKSEVKQEVMVLSDVFDKSYDETIITRYVGVGLKYKQKEFLAASRIKFELRYDYWFDMSIIRSGLGVDAEPLAGDYSGYEAKIKVEAVYESAMQQVVFQPQIEFSYAKVDAWLNNHDNEDAQLSVEGSEIEVRLLTTWLVDDSSLELSLGPEVVYETEREIGGAISLASESETIYLVSFFTAYELESYNLEFEFWFWHQIEGELKGENNLEFKLDWSF